MATQPLCQNARVIPAVLGLSRDDYPTPGTPLSEYPRTLELHQQSWDCPGMTTQPLGPLWQSIPERQSYTGSPGIVPDGYPTTLSERQSYTGSPGIVPGSDDYPTPGTFLSEYPRTPELHQQSWDGYPTPGTSLAGRVSQNTGVTPAVLGLSRDDYPTPGPLCQSIPERRSYSGSPGIVPG